ncbi:hypothetical protein Purlil1_10056 [Purpureocillium lilacinum]|uniref:Uncharacterized protein n=1 Tax=Purpureocillium lilacinum TaxID=33203 RepID=A0ABR0BND1_PURLI|nr:hypothetical protein Purlil1_10056 [Purpureocillium lilacinum]
MQGGGVTGWRLELQAQSCRVARGWAWPGVMGGGPSSTLTGQFCRRFPGAGKCSVRGGTGKTWCLIGQVSSIFCGQQSRPSPAQVLACRHICQVVRSTVPLLRLTISTTTTAAKLQLPSFPPRTFTAGWPARAAAAISATPGTQLEVFLNRANATSKQLPPPAELLTNTTRPRLTRRHRQHQRLNPRTRLKFAISA